MQRYTVLLYLYQYDIARDPKNPIHQVDAWFGSAEFRTHHPAIIVMPMLDQTKDPSANFGGKRAGRSWQHADIVALEQVKARYAIDPARIYVIGNSLGGMGTWDMLLCYNAHTGEGSHLRSRHTTGWSAPYHQS
jgi:hypothetical protein